VILKVGPQFARLFGKKVRYPLQIRFHRIEIDQQRRGRNTSYFHNGTPCFIAVALTFTM
jgi:hypothetical protein